MEWAFDTSEIGCGCLVRNAQVGPVDVHVFPLANINSKCSSRIEVSSRS
jgi:hypothetical protein